MAWRLPRAACRAALIPRYTRWVIYVPFATAETTGLPTKPVPGGAPWLLHPGTGGAHIMISPPRAATP